MQSSDAHFRVFLFARALRVPGGSNGSYRAVYPVEVDDMMHALCRRATPPLDMPALSGWFEGDAALYVPLLEKSDMWAFGSIHNSPALLRAFWRAVLELLFNSGFAVDTEPVPHPLIFFSLDRRFQLEITDEWGDGWYIIIQSEHSDVSMLARRSRAGTPEVLRAHA